MDPVRNKSVTRDGDWTADPGWFTVRNFHARSTAVPLDSRGLFHILASFSPSFCFNDAFLLAACGEDGRPVGRKKLHRMRSDLVAAGWIRTVRLRLPDGQLGGVIYELCSDIEARVLTVGDDQAKPSVSAGRDLLPPEGVLGDDQAKLDFSDRAPCVVAGSGQIIPEGVLGDDQAKPGVSAGRDLLPPEGVLGDDQAKPGVSAGRDLLPPEGVLGDDQAKPGVSAGRDLLPPYDHQRKTKHQEELKKKKNLSISPLVPIGTQGVAGDGEMDSGSKNEKNPVVEGVAKMSDVSDVQRIRQEAADYAVYLHRCYEVDPGPCTHSGPHIAPSCPRDSIVVAIVSAWEMGWRRDQIEAAINISDRIDGGDVVNVTSVLAARIRDKTRGSAPMGDPDSYESYLGTAEHQAAQRGQMRSEMASRAALDRARLARSAGEVPVSDSPEMRVQALVDDDPVVPKMTRVEAMALAREVAERARKP